MLADERTFYIVAFDEGEPIGFVFAYEFLRRHGDRSLLFVYDVEVAESHRLRGIATSLMREPERIARERRVRSGFVLTNESNEPAMKLYESLGGTRPHDDDVMWDFEYEDS